MTTKNKVAIALYIAFIAILSASKLFSLFLAAFAVAFFVSPPKKRGLVFKRALVGSLFFSGLSTLGAAVSSLIFNLPFDLLLYITLFFRAFCITALTLSVVERVGVFELLSQGGGRSAIFFVLLLAKIEGLKKDMEEFREAMQSRGFKPRSFFDSLNLLSFFAAAIFIKSLNGFRASAEALRSRGYGA